MDAIYRDVAPGDIPWNIETPPPELATFVGERLRTPCDIVDLGCGAGNYSSWLASVGFRVTGIDISREAIAIARASAQARGSACRFIVGDVVEGLAELTDAFDFAFDWEAFHHVFPDERPAWVASVARMLRSGGSYLSVSFAEADPAFGGTGRLRATPLGTVFSSEQEQRRLLEGGFEILDLRTVEVGGKTASHLVVWCWARKL